MGGAWRSTAASAVLMLLATPASAGEGAIGPCSPFRAADGDIPSEMPGCARRLRPAPGSLGDELQFRRARGGVADDDGAADDEAAALPRRGKRRRPAR